MVRAVVNCKRDACTREGPGLIGTQKNPGEGWGYPQPAPFKGVWGGGLLSGPRWVGVGLWKPKQSSPVPCRMSRTFPLCSPPIRSLCCMSVLSSRCSALFFHRCFVVLYFVYMMITSPSPDISQNFIGPFRIIFPFIFNPIEI